MLRRLLLVFTCLVIASQGFGQSTLKGVVTDEDGMPIAFAEVMLFQGGSLMHGTATNFDGNYLITPID